MTDRSPSAGGALGDILSRLPFEVQQIASGERDVYRLAWEHGSERVPVYIEVAPAAHLLLGYGVALVEVPPERRLAVAELITRINYGLPVGNFELDLGDGEVRFKSSASYAGLELGPELVRNVLLPCPLMVVRYLPAIRAVLSGTSPLAALEAAASAGEQEAPDRS